MDQIQIPKKIHYFWFGGKAKPARVEKCIASWKRFCPDFEIIEWNESNYDIHKHPFMERAYADEKWAFVTDYARLDVLYEYGGIYLDTDVELIKDLTPLCAYKGYIGFERIDLVNDGQGFGCVRKMPILKEMLVFYDYAIKGQIDYIESPKLRTEALIKHGLKLNGTMQRVADMQIFPMDYFCPKDWHTGLLKITENSYSIHHFEGSWHEKRGRKYIFVMRLFNICFGKEKGTILFKKLIAIKDSLKERKRSA